MIRSSVVGLVVIGMVVSAHAQSGNVKSKPRKVNAPAHFAAPVEEVLLPLTEAQLGLAQHVVLGKVPCELGAQVTVAQHPSAAGYFVLEHGKQKYRMMPVPTTTGAIRLEDASGGATWLQLANKSMLLDQKQGRRLADACMNADQTVVADNLATNPAPSLLEPAPPAAAPKLSVKVVQAATN